MAGLEQIPPRTAELSHAVNIGALGGLVAQWLSGTRRRKGQKRSIDIINQCWREISGTQFDRVPNSLDQELITDIQRELRLNAVCKSTS